MKTNFPFFSRSYDRIRKSLKSLVQQLMPAFTVLIILSSVSVAVVMYLKHRHYLYDQFRENIAKIKDDQHNRSV